MENIPLIDLENIARQLKLPVAGVQQAAELLEEGNTVPFITRFRRDQTGGLDEQQVRMIEGELKRAKLLAERKESILKSVESRGKLTERLKKQISSSRTIGELEDIYLPYKPKKQSLASIARSRGLEPLATSVLQAGEDAQSVEELAAAYVDAEKSLPDLAAVIEGLKHLVAEHFGNHRQLRGKLRKHLSKHGTLVSRKIDQAEFQEQDADETSDDQTAEAPSDEVAAGQSTDAKAVVKPEDAPTSESETESPNAASEEAKVEEAKADEASSEGNDREVAASDVTVNEVTKVEVTDGEQTNAAETTAEADSPDATDTGVATSDVASITAEPDDSASATDTPAESTPATESASTEPEAPEADQQNAVASEPASATAPSTDTPSPDASATDEASAGESAPSSTDAEPKPPAVKSQSKSKKKSAKGKSAQQDAVSRRDQRRETRRRRRERLVQSFKDYFDFSDPIGRIPHHRILAINRGERTKVLRVKIECADWDRIHAEAEKTAIPEGHPHAEFLRVCLQDAMSRLLQPSIEREVRRKLTDSAEEHAVTVFARNLRKLLLQPPLHQHRVVAIDPGFRSGCKLVALDEFGQILGHTFINLLGKEPQKKSGREGLAKFIREHKATVVAVGNGAACRETETLVAEVLSDELKGENIGYLIVNEAGTSVYSTSELGREELPDVDATVRSAVSIGRRSLDPLSELVKIDPASIGVGLYQHDVKAKHLRESLDDVVESCVNFVGVDVNSASPALLRYVSGLNSLKARKIYEYRQAHGPFTNREQLKQVSGVGDASYIQAAGFLKITGGDNPLDGTWIHPESYETATKVLEAIGFNPKDLGLVTNARVSASCAAASDVLTTEDAAASTEVVAPAVAATEAVATEAVATEAVATESAAEASDAAAAPADTATPQDDKDGVETMATHASKRDAGSADESVAGGEAASVQAAESSESATATDAAAESTESSNATVEPVPDTAGEASDAGGESTTTPTAESSMEPAADQPNPSATSNTDADAAPVQSGKSERAARLKELTEKLSHVDVDKLSAELSVGKLTLQDMLSALARPGRDPREDLPPPIFRTGILKLEDLKPGMELSGTVLNVVDFGAFVDIGLVDSGLIHVSRLADRFISDPHDVVSVGDILRVWVVEVDQKRRRVSLTAIEPGTEKPRQSRDSSSTQRRSDSRGSKDKEQRRRPRAERGGKPGKFSRGKSQKTREYKPKAPPKPVVPLTKEMEEGKEPMRTFGDLKQLFEKKKRGDS